MKEKIKEKLCPFCGKEIFKEDFNECPYCHRIIKERITLGEKENSEIVGEYPEKETPKERTYLNYAGFWIRFGAFAIDYALILILSFAIGYLFPLFTISLLSLSDEILGFIIIIAYHTFFLSIYSFTPGKKLFGLEVVDEKTREKLTFGKALGRSLSYILSSILLGLGFWNIVFDKSKHQGWHDKIAKTLVIKKTKKSLILPIILSAIAVCVSLWVIYSGEKGYDFSYFTDFGYLGREATAINSIQQKISKQPPAFCCSYISPDKIVYYLKEIPSELLFSEKKNAEQIFEKFSKAIVTIGGEARDGGFSFGSGFLISPSGLVVTNFHVIEDMDKLAVALIRETIQVFDANLIVAADSIKDIAVIKIEGQNLPYIFMGDSELMKTGQKVFAIGNPEGYTNTLSDGIISQIREFQPGVKSFQTTASISQGSSGGALFNESGEVIGITNMTDWYGQNLNFAIPINYVKELIGLKQNASEPLLEEFSDLIFCNGQYWNPCPIGQKFHCPNKGDPFCCPGTILNDECCIGIVCNNKCWSPCEAGYKFRCPPIGDPYCE